MTYILPTSQGFCKDQMRRENLFKLKKIVVKHVKNLLKWLYIHTTQY